MKIIKPGLLIVIVAFCSTHIHAQQSPVQRRIPENNSVQTESAPKDSVDASKLDNKFKSWHYFELGVIASYFNKTKAPSNDPAVSELYDKRDVRTSICFGYHFQKQFTSSLFLITGMHYVERGASYKHKNNSVTVVTTSGSGGSTKEDGEDYLNYRLSYAEIPINLGIKLNRNPEQHYLIVAGVNPMFNIVSKARVSYYDGPSNDLDLKWEQVDLDFAKKAIVACNVGLEVGVKRFYILLMYNAPLSKVYNIDGGYERFDVNMQSFNFSIGMGL